MRTWWPSSVEAFDCATARNVQAMAATTTAMGTVPVTTTAAIMILEGITASIADKCTYNISRELVQAGAIWLFEAVPRGPSRRRR